MSHYINEHTTLSAIKTLMDADGTLYQLLSVDSGGSKVILGQERPEAHNLPAVHLSFLTRSINSESKLNNILVRITWYVNALPGPLEDIESLSEIGERIYDLLDDNQFTISGYSVKVFTAESGETSANDLEQPEGRDNHFQSLTFRLVITRHT